MPTRSVKFATFWALLRSKGPFIYLGLGFMLVPLLFIPLIALLTNLGRQPYERYDYDTIKRDGATVTAQLTDITPARNVTVNGEHPLRLSYAYSDLGQTKTDKFQTMDPASANLAVGNNVDIKVLGGESVIPSLTPFSFPFYVFYFLPLIFVVLGLPFLLISLVPALRSYRLYKYGVVQEGRLLGIAAQPSLLSLFTQQSYLVSYEYAGRRTPRLTGSSASNDVLLVQEQRFGDTVKLFVSPDDETRSCLVPRLEALQNNWQL